MLLSGKTISSLIESGKIKISGHKQSKINPASYALTLGSTLLRPKGVEEINFKTEQLPEYEELIFTENGYLLQPGEFILGQTAEKLTLSPNIAALIEGRSTLARVGIEVVQSSGFIEPNHKDSIITLEIKNNSASPFRLFENMKFVKALFFRLSQEAAKASTTYETQEKTAPPKNTKSFFSGLFS